MWEVHGFCSWKWIRMRSNCLTELKHETRNTANPADIYSEGLSQAERHGGRSRILVVDDEPVVCESVRMMLASEGHQVETATSAEAAEGLFAEAGFDLMIVDHELPGMKGNELAAVIKAHDPDQPVLMITAHVEELLSRGNNLAGVDLMIGKPFAVQELRRAVGNLLAERRVLV